MTPEEKRAYDRARYRRLRSSETCAEKGNLTVYLIRTCGYEADGKTWVKLGSAKNPELRRQKLQCGCPLDLEILHYVEVPREKALQVEATVRDQYKELHARGEWLLVSWAEGYQIRDTMEELAYEAKTKTTTERRDVLHPSGDMDCGCHQGCCSRGKAEAPEKAEEA